jgi:hypothetical protein
MADQQGRQDMKDEKDDKRDGQDGRDGREGMDKDVGRRRMTTRWTRWMTKMRTMNKDDDADKEAPFFVCCVFGPGEHWTSRQASTHLGKTRPIPLLDVGE